MVGLDPLTAYVSKSAGEASRICLRTAAEVENDRRERRAVAERVRRTDMAETGEQKEREMNKSFLPRQLRALPL